MSQTKPALLLTACLALVACGTPPPKAARQTDPYAALAIRHEYWMRNDHGPMTEYQRLDPNAKTETAC